MTLTFLCTARALARKNWVSLSTAHLEITVRERELNCGFQGVNRINALQQYAWSYFPLRFLNWSNDAKDFNDFVRREKC